jgi:hypothetical protein
MIVAMAAIMMDQIKAVGIKYRSKNIGLIGEMTNTAIGTVRYAIPMIASERSALSCVSGLSTNPVTCLGRKTAARHSPKQAKIATTRADGAVSNSKSKKSDTEGLCSQNRGEPASA